MEQAYARRSLPQRVRFATAVLLILWSLASISTGIRSSILSETHPSAVPLHAADIIHKCKALRATPGPPADFADRTKSDRFQPGTRPILIRNASLWTGRVQGLEVVQGDLYIDNGLIKAVGYVTHESIDADNVYVLDVHGAWVTPGIVDLHSHLAVDPSPTFSGSSDVNSMNGLILPWLRSLDAINTHDDGFADTVSGGVTTSLILPGSADAIGGQAFVIKLRPTKDRTPTSMLLEPPFTINGSVPLTGNKMTGTLVERTLLEYILVVAWTQLGLSVKRAYSPFMPMNDITLMVDVFRYDHARTIKHAQDEYCSDALAGNWQALTGRTFPEDLQWEALVDVLRGRVKVQTHCYEAVDFDSFVRLSNEFQFPVAAFHHAHEAYLVPELLKKTYGNHPPAIAMFAAFSRYKREAYRHSEYAPRILADSDIQVVMKSDHPGIVSRYLLNEAAQAHYYGLPENIALASVISTPATVLGLDHRIGFLKEGNRSGYDADVVVWDSHPLSLGATPSQVIIDGIPQISVPHTVKKPASYQHAPKTPNFDKEAVETLRHSGLPPLKAAQSTSDIVVFTNVTHVWVKDAAQGVVDLFAMSNNDNLQGTVVVAENGRIVCSGSSVLCASYVTHPEAEAIDLKGGSLQPGLVSFGSALGLQEISMESSTTEGVSYDPFTMEVPSIAGGSGYMPRAIDALQYGTRDALLAYRHGVTVGVTAPERTSLLGGLSAGFALGSAHKLERGAIVQEVTALHIQVAHQGAPSVSTQIATLRQYLLHSVGEGAKYFQQVVNGTLPLVIDVNSADIIATLISLKREVEASTGTALKMTIAGATEAHLLAKELSEANIGVILTPARSYPYDWDHRRTLPGTPVTQYSAVAELARHKVKVGLGPQGVNGISSMNTWAVRNLRFDATWAYIGAPDIFTKADAFALASSNIEDLLGVKTIPGEEDLVATTGGDLLGFEGKVTARGNPILESVRNIGKEFGDIVADYQVGRTTGVLFLSLRYHRLHPEYIHQRIERLGRSYNLRILLLMCDVSEHQEPIRELTKVCLINNMTIMVAWNAEEAGFYLSTYKQFEHKPPDMIKERVDKDYYSMLRTALTSISKVNKTDVETLRTSLGVGIIPFNSVLYSELSARQSFADIARASSDQLQKMPGFGQVKARRIVDAFEKPFRNSATSTLSSQRQAGANSDKGKGKQQQPDVTSTEPAVVVSRRARDPSPLWDIGLDLNDHSSPDVEAGPAIEHHNALQSLLSPGSRKRPPSPVWDIELDLNESDQESEAGLVRSKKRKTDATFGEPSVLLKTGS
ncbi:uncharacterized protein FIBRA_05730 [Fibroporia radiculosa]|uniref:ERCC1-like central domain-containing protein n=1 Tax=Fibroporia radiculosa TaxID=599839 RepID=J4GA04_9APHY|nr:uncharacterized protein FIBRA_05730 [Fibroporia radiculosa]CCM03593.1 predicted protein [Fibroporia radiculosa]